MVCVFPPSIPIALKEERFPGISHIAALDSFTPTVDVGTVPDDSDIRITDKGSVIVLSASTEKIALLAPVGMDASPTAAADPILNDSYPMHGVLICFDPLDNDPI